MSGSLRTDDSISFRLPAPQGGRYDVFEEFASGGVASVHFARHVTPSGLSQVVAIKRLHPQHAKDPGFRAALLDEARLIARIQHPNVVRVLDVHDRASDLFIAMEYVHGISLSRALGGTAGRPLEPSIAVSILVSALRGLHAAHEAHGPDGQPLQIVHRDVSPQNILIGADGVTRVIDFGLAYALGRSHATQSGVVKGKPSYMSPEQVRGERVSRASDVFSAGVVLWGMLTGRKLFEADTVEGTVFQVLVDRIRPPSELVHGLPATLDSVIMRALERAPAGRYPTALAMAKALESAVGPAPPSEVADWVGLVGREWLADMAESVRAIETAPVGDPPGGSEPEARRSGPTAAHARFAASEARPVPDDTVRDLPRISESSPMARRAVTGLLLVSAVSVGWIAAHVAGQSAGPSASPSVSPARASVDAPEPSAASAAPDPPSVDSSEPIGPTIELGPAESAHAPRVPPRVPRRRRCNDPLNPKCN